jgi:Uma2 family endonuclease
MVTISPEYRHLPTAEDLPDSDETPVDNELQNDIPNMLLNVLRWIWAERSDWFWGVDMGVYYEPNLQKPEDSKAIVPDGFLALGVPRGTGERGRLSYVLWQEQVLPILSLEVVSKKYGGEYDRKFADYQSLGILYYVIYNLMSGRKGLYKKHQSLEVYKLIDGKYELMPSTALLQSDGATGRMVWLPEVGLGIGCERREQGSWQREWLYWYDRQGVRYLTAEERATNAEAIASQEQQKTAQEQFARQEAEAIASQERQQKEKLAAYLRSIGVNPDQI